ncbi:MAG TPA: hypothetical protein VML75_24600 [Kofleriaceae bacterium]|nr:hypothetical protein [Kofleriaceae bacterium]
MRLRVAAAALSLLVGCSVALTKRVPSDHPPDEAPECTAGYSLALADSLFAVLYGVGAVTLLATADDPDDANDSLTPLGIGAIVLGSLHLVSAGYGAYQRNRCRAAQDRAPLPDPNRYRPDAPGPGNLGGPCLNDGTCEGILRCDPPMRTCVEPTD